MSIYLGTVVVQRNIYI